MKIVYYCQHVLGVGHFHRSLEICHALARRHQVIMITGGQKLDISTKSIRFLQLPGLMMDSDFNNLEPCEPELNLEDVRNERKEMMLDFFEAESPEVFLVELYPFGRKAFRFELDPILEGIRSARLAPCLTYCSLRDILVERKDRERFEKRIITTLNTLFDGLLIHGDKKITSLAETFSRVADISIPISYTGYVTPKPATRARENIRKTLGLSSDVRLIVASIGGGNVGRELLEKLACAIALLPDEKVYLQIFTGPYAEDDLLFQLQKKDIRIGAQKFTSNFPDWLAAADLSVSMAGYNTCMNIVAAGVPALLHPFDKNQEQYLRVKKLVGQFPVALLEKKDLQPEILIKIVMKQLEKKRFTATLNLDGAANTVLQVEKWHDLLSK